MTESFPVNLHGETGGFTAEQYHTERLKKIFALPDPESVNRYGVSVKERSGVTETSENEAAKVALFAMHNDTALESIYRKYEQATGCWHEKDLPRMLRENPDMRTEVGAYLLEKIAVMHNLPDRVASNLQGDAKSPNHGGYDRNYAGQVYAVILALAMLDGTFKWAENDSDSVEKNEYGDVTLGKHRYAAYMVLGIENDLDTIKACVNYRA